MRKLFILAALAGLAACGQRSGEERAGTEAADSAGVSVTAAPGVAFNYRYAFRLPNARISVVQEEHAAACERLGLARCRITGMRYRVVDEDHVSAMLALKLDPTLARSFGKDAAATVRKAEGMLVDTEISGTGVGTGLARTGRDITEGRAELARLEAQLARGDLRPADRARIEAQAAELRRLGRALESQRTDAEESLATTPMVFDYGAGGRIPGFEGSPLRDALATAAGSFVTMLSFIIIAIGALVPWIVAALALLLLARSRLGAKVRSWLRPRAGFGELPAE
jgi:hypothetical protein